MNDADKTTPADRFRRMADTIDHNKDRGYGNFGGAAVIIPPTVSGFEKPIEVLFLDWEGDPAQFLSSVMTKLDLMIREINDRKLGQFGR